MIVENVNDLECDLVPLDKIKVNLKNRHLLTLKDNFNVKEVEHFVEWVGQRLFSYQFATFYEYGIQLKKSECTVSHELFKDYDNRITNEKEDFYRFSYQVKTSIENKHQSVNNGPDKLENVEWNFSVSFINIDNLSKIAFINTEDLSFKQKEACFFGRSIVAYLVQEYVKVHHQDKALRNFIIIDADAPENKVAAEELMKKQRDLCLTRDETKNLLKSIKCVETKKDFSVLATKGYSLTK